MLDVTTLLVCDDIRVEASGKHTIVGVYLNDIQVVSFPGMFSFAIWLQGTPRELGEGPLNIKVEDGEGRELLSGDLQVRIGIIEQTTFPLRGLGVQVLAETTLHFRWMDGEGVWQTARSLPLRKTEEAKLAVAT